MRRRRLIILMVLTLVLTLITAACGKATPILPVTTSAATSITSSSATLNGSVTNTGGENADQRGFDWGTSSGNYSGSWTESGSFGTGSFSQEVTGLNPGTIYYFRAKAHNSSGWGYGNEQSFTTLTPARVTSVTPNSANQGQTLDVTIAGANFTGATAISFGDGITGNRFNISNDTQITANITIAADAAPGTRDVSVTTPAGTGTLTDGFTVTPKPPTKQTVIWSDDDFNSFSHLLTGNPPYNYQTRFQDNNQLYILSVINFTFDISVRDGRLCFARVPGIAWQDIYSAAHLYLNYDSNAEVMTVTSLPEKLTRLMFGTAIDNLPIIESITTSEGKMTVIYHLPQN